MKYDKINLPYKFNDLEPYIDAETVETHYSKHLQGYVNNLNSIVEKSEDFFQKFYRIRITYHKILSYQ